MGKQLTATQRRARTWKKFWVFLALSLLLMGVGLLAPSLVPYDPTATDPLHLNAAPSALHLFGTDSLGRDTFSRVLMGAQTSIFSAVVLVIITLLIGTVLGVLSGYFGGAVDMAIMRIADVLLAFPQMVFAIAVAGILGGGMINAMLALGITGWTLYARLARSSVLAIKKEPYVLEARLTGCSHAKIIVSHIFPNIMGPLVVNATTQLAVTMIGIAGLSFLGIGVTPPQAEWGSMINEARAALQIAPWNALTPAAAIMVTVMIFNYLGETARDLLDVKSR